MQPDEIYNLGAQSHVRVSFDVPEYTASTVGAGHAAPARGDPRARASSRRFYQASSSEMFGAAPPPQNEAHAVPAAQPVRLRQGVRPPALPELPRGLRHVHRAAASCSTTSRRAAAIPFVTRKITRAAARIKHGLDKKLYLGNLDAKRDWGFAGDYVEAMWLMLQQDKPDDYVIATGESHTRARVPRRRLRRAGPRLEAVRRDRPALLPPDRGRPPARRRRARRARSSAGSRRSRFKELIEMMVRADEEDVRLVAGGPRAQRVTAAWSARRAVACWARAAGRALLPAARGGLARWRPRAARRVRHHATPGAVRALLAGARPDVVFNAAAYTDVDRAESEPDAAYAVNAARRRERLARAAAAVGAAAGSLLDRLRLRRRARRGPTTSATRRRRRACYARVQAGRRRGWPPAAKPRHFVLRVGCLYGRGGRNFPSTIVRRLRAGETIRADSERLGSPTWVREVAGVSAALAAHRALRPLPLHLGRARPRWADFAASWRAELGVPAERVQGVCPRPQLPLNARGPTAARGPGQPHAARCAGSTRCPTGRTRCALSSSPRDR